MSISEAGNRQRLDHIELDRPQSKIQIRLVKCRVSGEKQPG